MSLLFSVFLPLSASLASLLPAAWRLYRNPTPDGLSFSSSCSYVISGIAWLFYSFVSGLAVSVVSSALSLVVSLATLHTQLKGRHIDDRSAPVLLFLSVVASLSIAGLPGLALILGLAPLTELRQSLAIVKKDAPALSLLSYGSVFFRTLPWVPYAVKHVDLAIGLWIVTCTLTNCCTLFFLARHRMVRRSR